MADVRCLSPKKSSEIQKKEFRVFWSVFFRSGFCVLSPSFSQKRRKEAKIKIHITLLCEISLIMYRVTIILLL